MSTVKGELVVEGRELVAGFGGDTYEVAVLVVGVSGRGRGRGRGKSW